MSPAKSKRRIKESYFVRIPIEDGPVLFTDASAYIGKEMPYSKVQATLAMRVDSDAVLFSLLHIPRRYQSEQAGKPIKLPRAAFRRLADKAHTFEVGPDDVWVELDLGKDTETVAYKYTMTRDENGVVTLDVADGFGAGDDKTDDPEFELPPRSLEVRLFFASPKLKRTVGVGFIGHLGKPRTPETVGRAGSLVLNSMTGLADFRLVSGIVAAKVPPAPKWTTRSVARAVTERATAAVPVRLFTEEFEPVGSGEVILEIDLETANQATGKLLYTAAPSTEIKDTFEPYRDTVIRAIDNRLIEKLGSGDVEMIALDVVLGEVSSGTIETLRSALQSIQGIDLTPKAYRFAADIE